MYKIIKCSEIVLLFSSFTVSAFLHCFERGFFVSCIDFYCIFFQFRTVFLLQIEFVYYLFFLVYFLYLLDFTKFHEYFACVLSFYFIFFILYKILFFLSFSSASPYPFVQFFKFNFFFFEWLVSPFCSKTKILSVAKKKCENVKL